MSDLTRGSAGESRDVLQAVIAAAIDAYLAAEREHAKVLARPRWSSAALAAGNGDVWPLGMMGWEDAEWPR